MTADRTISTILRSTLSLLNYYDRNTLGEGSALTDLKACMHRAILELAGDEAKASEDVDMDGSAAWPIRNRTAAIFSGASQEDC